MVFSHNTNYNIPKGNNDFNFWNDDRKIFLNIIMNPDAYELKKIDSEIKIKLF